jgi:hypothetical protein
MKLMLSSEAQVIVVDGEVDVLLRAELLGEGNAAEVLARLALLPGHHVEDDEEGDLEWIL